MSLAFQTPLGITAADLAPADYRSAHFDWTGYTVCFIDSCEHARFGMGYDALWEEFGAKNEMEQRSVLAQRFAWHPEIARAKHALLYQMLLILHNDELVAVRDHGDRRPATT